MHKTRASIKRMIMMAIIGASVNVHAGDVSTGATNTPRRVEVGDLVYQWVWWRTPGGAINPFSSWEVSPTGTVYEGAASEAIKLSVVEGRDPTTFRRRFVATRDGVVTWEFMFNLPTVADGPSFALQSGTAPTVMLQVRGGKLLAIGDGAKAAELADLRTNQWYGVLAFIDLDAHQASFRINGRKHATPVALAGKAPALDHVAISTGKGARNDLLVGPVLLYRGYALRERFMTTSEGMLPDGWSAETTGGSVSVQRAGGANHAQDQQALKLEKRQSGPVAAQTLFAPMTGGVEIACKLLNTNLLDGVRLEVLNTDKQVVATLATRDGGLVAVDADKRAQVLWKGCRPTVWYDLRIEMDPETQTARYFVNGVALEAKSKVPAFRGGIAGLRVVLPETGAGTIWVDNLVVCRHLPYPADYVAEPQPVDTGEVLVGAQSCDLWREGSHNGWDCMLRHPELKPLLGWYNGGDPEVEDWAIKWMCENGIAFDFKCWYRDFESETGMPIHSTRHSEGLEGFKRARWSKKLRVAINLTNHCFMFANMEDWKQNVVPYLIEQLFRDPRYLVIDNKPVLGIYSPEGLRRDAGGGAALNILREECRKAGFAGCWVLSQDRGTGAFAGCAREGYDAMYSYAWETLDAQQMRAKLERCRGQKDQDSLATVCMGWDFAGWSGPKQPPKRVFDAQSQQLKLLEAVPGPKRIPVETFREVLQWTRDTYMAGQPTNALSRRVLTVANWNEWGEGQILMPAVGYGFGYVNAVREVFGKGPFPANVTPTPAQQARLDTLYPSSDWDGEEPGAAVTQNADGSLLLPAEMAFLPVPGPVIYKGNPSCLGQWGAPYVVGWQVKITQPGKFAVRTRAASPGSEKRLVVEASGQSLNVTLPKTASFDVGTPVECGTLTLDKPGKYDLIVRPVSAGWGPVNMGPVTLEPVKETETKGTK